MDILKNIDKQFSNSKHQNFDSIQQSLIELLHRITIASKNGYYPLLNSNAWGKYYHKLTIEELFVMNLHDNEILAILNLSIYQSISKNDYSILIDGVFTYTRLRMLNRYSFPIYEWAVIESLITNDQELRDLGYSHSLPFNNEEFYDPTMLLSKNLLQTILLNPNFKTQTLEQYSRLIGNVSSKFDHALLNYLYGILTTDPELCEISFQKMEQLYGRCQWLTIGWYRGANLNKTLPIFLLGLHQLKSFTNTNFDLTLKNEFLRNVKQFFNDNPNYKAKLLMPFNGELTFLNKVLTNNFALFYSNFTTKMNEIISYSSK